MATARQTRKDAIEGRGCLGRAKDDEPVFVLRAQDLLAARLVDIWALYAEQNDCPRSKVAEARKIAAEMRVWALNNPAKHPD